MIDEWWHFMFLYPVVLIYGSYMYVSLLDLLN
jgi:hypothetical protein